MNPQITGQLIRTLRAERDMTQRQLADLLGITDRAVSKWERGLGSPDIALLSELSRHLGVPVDRLLSEDADSTQANGGSMRNLHFFICPHCGNLITASSTPTVSCCGRLLEALSPQKPDDAHRLIIEQVENDWYLTTPHPMEKHHYMSFAALVNGEQAIVVKRWPEWDFQVRFPKRGHGILYWCCTKHGLFRQPI